jgi:hypothetical protein
MYNLSSLSDTWNPGANHMKIDWNPRHQRVSKPHCSGCECSAPDNWNPGRHSSHTGGFLLVVAMKGLLVQCQLININKLVSGEEQGPTSGEVVLLSKMETLKNHRN